MPTETTNMTPVDTATISLNDVERGRFTRCLLSAAIATANDNRQALNTILVEMNATEWTFTASDSYWLAHVTMTAPLQDTPTVGAWQIHRDTVKTWTKPLKTRYAHATIAVDDRSLSLTVDQSTFSDTRPHAEFPRYRTLIPAYEQQPDTERYEPTPWAMNPDKFAAMVKAARIACPNDTTPITNQCHTRYKPNVWTISDDGIHALFLMMPIRTA